MKTYIFVKTIDSDGHRAKRFFCTTTRLFIEGMHNATPYASFSIARGQLTRMQNRKGGFNLPKGETLYQWGAITEESAIKKEGIF